MEYGFGLASIRGEGCPIDPIDAIEFTGPGATPEWFKRQQHAFFEHRRARGDTEEELMRHPFYLPPNVELI